MRLLKFLNESGKIVSVNLDQIVKIILSECSDFVKLRIPLWKGFSVPTVNSEFVLQKFNVPVNRAPRKTPPKLYAFINQWLKTHNFVSRETAVVTTTSKGMYLPS